MLLNCNKLLRFRNLSFENRQIYYEENLLWHFTTVMRQKRELPAETDEVEQFKKQITLSSIFSYIGTYTSSAVVHFGRFIKRPVFACGRWFKSFFMGFWQRAGRFAERVANGFGSPFRSIHNLHQELKEIEGVGAKASGQNKS